MRTNRSNAPGHASQRAGTFALVLLAALASADLATAQDASCVDLCSSSCIKPWSIPDRWDDVTGIPGYMGEAVSGRVRRPDWRNNAQYDREDFMDLDGDGSWDPDESYVDGNGNGQYDLENYHPSLTGYTASPVPGNFLSPEGDLGLEFTLHPGSTFNSPSPGQYLAFALPPINKGAPILLSDDYRLNIAECNPVVVERGDRLQLFASLLTGPTNQGMQDLIAQDPNAEWDDATQSVTGSNFALSPRIVFLPVHDPRSSVANAVSVVKLAAFFMEQMTGNAEVRGRFLRAIVPGGSLGAPCVAGEVGGFLVDCPVPAAAASWGRVKATYR